MKPYIQGLSVQFAIYTGGSHLFYRIVCHSLDNFYLEVAMHDRPITRSGETEHAIYRSRCFASQKLAVDHARILLKSILKYGKHFFDQHTGDPLFCILEKEPRLSLGPIEAVVSSLARKDHGTWVGHDGQVHV